jgi:hypothetical protein
VVLVEGQADAVTFAEWGVPAIALAGMQMSPVVLASLKKHKRVFVSLDNTPEAAEKGRELGAHHRRDRAAAATAGWG